MLISLLIILPLLAGLILIGLKNSKSGGVIGTAVSVVLLALSVYLIFGNSNSENIIQFDWFKIGEIQAKIALNLNGLGGTLVLLSALVYTLLFLYLNSVKEKYSNSFHGL